MKPFAPKTGKPGIAAFWAAFKMLLSLGLVEFIDHLVDGGTDDAAILHPYPLVAGEPGERAIAAHGTIAAEAMLTPAMLAWHKGEGGWDPEGNWDPDGISGDRDKTFDVLAPIPAHIGQVQLVGVARLRCQPHTALTAEWLSKDRPKWDRWARHYQELAAQFAEVRTAQRRA